MDNKILSFYIHIPFCDHICSYCDFNKIVCSDELKEKYINALIKDINNKKKYYNDLETIYIGGGTPSCLKLELLIRLLDSIKNNIDLNRIKEFTFECNPYDINNNNIDTWINLFKKYKINRISLGIQSFRNKKLIEMNRNHKKSDAILALKLLHKNHFDNVNCDLIYGFTNDNFNNIKKDINIALRNHVKHISYYSLILEKNTILYYKANKGLFKEMNSDYEGILYNKIYRYLFKKNVKRYEISNFAYNNYKSIHNFNVWSNLHYIGVGVSASYYINNIRYTNIKSINDYISFINNNKYDSIINEKIILTKKDIMDEEILLGLRTDDGIDILHFNEKYNVNIYNEYKNIELLLNEDILKCFNNKLFINCDKMYLENAILEKILF